MAILFLFRKPVPYGNGHAIFWKLAEGRNMDFRETIEKLGVVRRERAVDPFLEGSVISRKDMKSAWMADVKDDDKWSMAGNVYSSRSTLAMALGTDLQGITDIMMKGACDPRPVRMVDQPDYYRSTEVSEIPIPTYFEGDGGPYITSAIFHAGFHQKRNLSFHRMMYMGGNRFAVRVVPRHLKALIKEARDQGEDLPAVVSIGADPYSLLAGSTALGYGEDEFEVASSIRTMALGEPLKAFTPEGSDLLSPLGTELILTGKFVDEKVPEGPFVDITSTYDHAGMDPGEPVFEADRAIARKDPIFHFLLPGGYEHYQMMGLPKEPSIKKTVGMVVPRVHGVRLTEGGCCWLHGVVSITPQKQGDSKNAVMAAFTGHPSMKRVVVVNSDIDIFDDAQVEWALATRFQGDRDLFILPGARGSTLDPSSPEPDMTTTKIGMDATIPVGREEEFQKVD
jgi:UbiD family decarboxylase